MSTYSHATDVAITQAANRLCILAESGLPDGYRLSLVVENGESSIELTDPDGNEIELHGESCAWLDAIDTANEKTELLREATEIRGPIQPPEDA